MRAAVTVSTPTGPGWRIREVDAPVPGDDDVLVEVAAAGLNHADLLMMRGDYVPSDAGWRVAPDRVGFELAGTVAAVGATVRNVSIGDEVMAQAGGACAEQVVVDAGLLLPRRGVAARGAAALASGLLTEFDALQQAGFAAGDDVLVTGAGSGVGRIGVQLARARGAGAVVACIRSGRHVPDLAALGAEVIVGEHLAARLSRRRNLIVLDHVGGAPLAAIVDAVPHGTRIVQIGRLGGIRATLDLERLAAQRIQLTGTTFRGRALPELRALVAAVNAAPALANDWGGLQPSIDSVFALADAARAAARLSARDRAGKVVIDLGSAR